MKLNLSRILFIAILIATFASGAFLSYLWVVGYYVSLGLKTLEKPVVSICNFTVSAENPTFFNITVFNPLFSPKETKILKIEVLTEDNALYEINSTNPSIPNGGYTLNVGDSENFVCFWEWTNHSGEKITVVILVSEGSGGVLQTTLPLVEVEITEFTFDLEHGDYFNITVKNSERSAIGINLVEVKLTVKGLTSTPDTQPPLPLRIEPGESVSLLCRWNWTDYERESIRITVNTSQGYRAETTYRIP